MRYAEVNLFGVFVSPVAIMLVAAWLILVLLRRAADALGLRLDVWHPALFTLSAYIVILSGIVVLVGV